MKTILVTGASGLIGSSLVKKLIEHGHTVHALSRSPKPSTEHLKWFSWDLQNSYLDPDALKGVDIIVHLAGENIGKGRWSNNRKKAILSSRVQPIQLLLRSLEENTQTIKAFISASAVGYYGVEPTEHEFVESDKAGNDFLGEVCKQWEDAILQFQSNCPVTLFRTGVVLANQGGFLKEMLKLFKYKVASVIGDGKQYIPWIHIEDVTNAYLAAIEEKISPNTYNLTAPEHATNKEMMHSIAASLDTSIWLPPVPKWILKLVLGEMSDLVIKGNKVVPKNLQSAAFNFKYPKLEKALNNIIQR